MSVLGVERQVEAMSQKASILATKLGLLNQSVDSGSIDCTCIMVHCVHVGLLTSAC